MDIKTRFTEVIRENAGLIYKVVSIYTNNAEDKADLYQEIVYQLWKSFPSFKEKSKLSTWMYRVALNTAFYHLKQSKKILPTSQIDAEALGFADTHDPAEEEKISILYQYIQLLNALEKGIVLLYLEGKSHEDIAVIVGISTSNVGTRMARIKEKLRMQLTKTQ